VDQPNLGEGGEDAKDPWRIYIRCCRNRLPAPTTSSDSRQDAPGASSETHELREGEETLQRVFGRLEGRLELIEVAESTLPEESLERERERADAAELERVQRSWGQHYFGD
jgi:hypothetical protein